LASLHGKTVALIFVDALCTEQAASCASLQELRLVDQVLGTKANQVELVAIEAKPKYLTQDQLVSFDGRAGLDKMSNCLLLTGSPSELRSALNGFGVEYISDPVGAVGHPQTYMMGLPHGQMAYVIDGSGRTREVLTIGDRVAVSKTMESSTAVALANAVERVSRS
jgi:cytochrome oxidase Cu insertion factor (SCO1/SenC/PrrC family)